MKRAFFVLSLATGLVVAIPASANTLGDPMDAAFSRFVTCTKLASERLDHGQAPDELIAASEAACNLERSKMLAQLEWQNSDYLVIEPLDKRSSRLRAMVKTYRQVLLRKIEYQRENNAPNN